MEKVELGGITLRPSDASECDVDGCGNENCHPVRLEEGQFNLCDRHLMILVGRVGRYVGATEEEP